MSKRDPAEKGTAIPASETLSADDPILRKSRMSTSMPVSASRRTPNSANTRSTAFCDGFGSSPSRRGPRDPTGPIGKTACCAAGQTRPKNEWPSRIPALSWPIASGRALGRLPEQVGSEHKRRRRPQNSSRSPLNRRRLLSPANSTVLTA
jgi:hypothetical protein